MGEEEAPAIALNTLLNRPPQMPLVHVLPQDELVFLLHYYLQALVQHLVLPSLEGLPLLHPPPPNGTHPLFISTHSDGIN